MTAHWRTTQKQPPFRPEMEADPSAAPPDAMQPRQVEWEHDVSDLRPLGPAEPGDFIQIMPPPA